MGTVSVLADGVAPDAQLTAKVTWPATVHTPGVAEANETGSPDEAVADTVNGAAPKTWFASGPNVIVWAAGPEGNATSKGTSPVPIVPVTISVAALMTDRSLLPPSA